MAGATARALAKTSRTGALGLADVFVEQFCALHGEEGSTRLMGERPHDEGLAGSGWAVEQQAPRWLDPQPGESLGLTHLPDDGLGEPLFHLVEVGDALEAI